jgi:hypothetical protein
MTPNNSNLTQVDPNKTVGEPLAPLAEDGNQRAVWRTVYTVVDRGHNKKLWLRVGVAFVNRDGSLNVRLDAMPVNGQLYIREALPRDGRDNGGDLFTAARESRASWRD